MKLILICILTSLATNSLASNSDEKLFSLIVGKWSSVFENDDFKSEATEEYRDDGTSITVGKVYIDRKVVEEYRYKSTWEVKNGYSNLEIIESSNTKILPIGHKISDKVIFVDEKEFTLESNDGVQITIIRQ